MKTWNDYKNHVKETDSKAYMDIQENECLANIISALIKLRNSLGISQRELAIMCNMPQSSIARIESFKTTPNIDTLLKIMKPLGLSLKVSEI